MPLKKKKNKCHRVFNDICQPLILISPNRIQNQLRLLVATENNVLYIYNVDANEAGILTLLRTHSLGNKLDEARSTTDGAATAPEAAGTSNDSGILAYALWSVYEFVGKYYK